MSSQEFLDILDEFDIPADFPLLDGYVPDAIEALVKEIHKLRGLDDNWLDVNIDTPQDSGMYQCLGGGYSEDGSYENWPHVKYWSNEFKTWNSTGITHWKPLPKINKKEEV